MSKQSQKSRNGSPRYAAVLYKIAGAFVLAVGIIAVLLGLLIFASGGWVLCALGAFLVVVGVLWRRKAKPKNETQKPEPVKSSAPAPIPDPEPAPAPAEAPAPSVNEKTYKVTGMSHHMDNLIALAFENDDYQLSKRELIENGQTDERVYEYEFYPVVTELVPEPDNPVDPNAIKVVVDGQHVGYIKAGSCKHLLKVIREDRIERIRCFMGGGKYKYVAFEDFTESGKEIYTMGKDETPYFVHLKIIER